MIFFVDPLTPMPHDVDVKALIRLAIVYDIPMALNLATGEILLRTRRPADRRRTRDGNAAIMEKPDAAALEFPILIGDIGGTNARFAVVIDAAAGAGEPQIVQTADFATIDEAIQAAVVDRLSVQPRSAILAVAGPVNGDEIPLTNCAWVVRPKDMSATLGLGDIVVLNDFEAQALAVVALDENILRRSAAANRGPMPAASFSAPEPASASPA